MILIRAKTNTQITSLNLSGKGLKQIPQEVFSCTNLKKLNFSNNNLSEIPKEITKLTKLEVLDLSQNQLRYIQAGLFHLGQLKRLNISHNQLKNLPIQINKLSNLTALMIQNNNIEEINHITLPSNLESLNISNNKIKDLNWISNLKKIGSLWISNNPIGNFNLESILEMQSLKLKRVYAYSSKQVTENLNSEYLLISLIKGNALKDSKLKKFNFQKENIIMDIVSTNSSKKKPHVFISYSHSNKKWLNRIIIHLKVLSNLNLDFDFWEDTKIRTGDDWLKGIETSINNADVALLLVSTDFLASQFVMKKEVPRLLENAYSKGTKIMPIILSPCLFTDTEIGVFQAANDPNKTLEECSEPEQERILTGLMKEIKEIINT